MKKQYFLIFVLFYLVIGTGKSQYKNIYDFTSTSGYWGRGSLTLSGSKLFGVEILGGTNSIGNIFSINTDGSGYKDLFDFNGINGDHPCDLIISGNVLYGMTFGDGISTVGNIYSIRTDGSGFKILLDFKGTKGSNPNGSLSLSGNTLYGVTWGGINGNGTIFSIDTSGNGYKNLADFKSLDILPTGTLTLSGNTLYGVTAQGGFVKNFGTIFSIQTDGTGYNEMLVFDSITTGAYPTLSTKLSGNVLFGITMEGGTNGYGTIFSINSNGSGYNNLLDFNGVNGKYPVGSLTLSGNILYGMTKYGGANDNGIIFSINTDGTGYKNLFDFNIATGGYPTGGSITIDGDILYGMTAHGGLNYNGVIFNFNTITGTPEISDNNNKVSIYPNPNSGCFTIQQINATEKQLLQVYDITGKLMQSQIIQSGKTSIDTNDLIQGLYNLSITNDSEKINKRLVIVK